MFGILRNNLDIVWIDVVESYSRDYSGQVTSHPVEDGSFITDHYIKNNLKIQISGLFSDADFNTRRPSVAGASLKNNQPVNASGNNQAVIITESSVNPLTKFLPENLLSLFNKGEIPILEVRGNKKKFNLLIEQWLLDIRDRGESFSLLVYDENSKLP